MNLTIKKKLGNAELSFDVAIDKHMDFFRDTAFIFDLPDHCGNCKSQNLKTTYSQPQGYEYGEVRCLDCNYKLTFGIRKADHYMFAKTWEPPYSGNGETEGSAPEQDAPAAPRSSGFGSKTAPSAPATKAAPSVSRPLPPQPKSPPAKTGVDFAKHVSKPAPAPTEVQVVAEIPATASEVQETVPAASAAPVLPNLEDKVSKLKAQYGIPNNLSKLNGVRR